MKGHGSFAFTVGSYDKSCDAARDCCIKFRPTRGRRGVIPGDTPTINDFHSRGRFIIVISETTGTAIPEVNADRIFVGYEERRRIRYLIDEQILIISKREARPSILLLDEREYTMHDNDRTSM